MSLMLWSVMVTCYKLAMVKALLTYTFTIFTTISTFLQYLYLCLVPSEYPANSDCSQARVPTFFIYRIMSDEHDNLNYEFDDHGDYILDQSED